MTSWRELWIIDALERLVWTSAQAAAGVLLDQLTSGSISWRAVGYAAAIAVVKVAAAGKIGNRASASTLPTALDPPPAPPKK